MDVLGEVDARDFDGKAETRCPLLRDGLKVFRRHAMVPRFLEDRGDRCSISSVERFAANSPEGEDE